MATKEQSGKADEGDKTDFSVTEAASAFGTLLGRVEFGREEITITKGKSRRPVAKLVPVEAA